jgi:hypothetical protein
MAEAHTWRALKQNSHTPTASWLTTIATRGPPCGCVHHSDRGARIRCQTLSLPDNCLIQWFTPVWLSETDASETF